MTDRSKRFFEVKGADNHVMTFSVAFQGGGINYMNYKKEPRGFCVSLRPIEKEGVTETWMFGSGIKAFLEEAPRYNAKKLNKLAEVAIEHPDVKRMYEQIAKDIPAAKFPKWDEVMKQWRERGAAGSKVKRPTPLEECDVLGK